MLFLINLALIGLALVTALAIAAAASAPQTSNLADDQPGADILAATDVRALPSQFSRDTSASRKIPAVVAAGLQ